MPLQQVLFDSFKLLWPRAFPGADTQRCGIAEKE